MSEQNPKDRAARGRVPLHLLPAAGRIHGALACRDGAEKYGPYNWRDKPISLMGYTAALERHLVAIRDGEDHAEDSGCHHLAHIVATASILLDAMECGTLIDDRPLPGPAPKLLADSQCDQHLARVNLPTLRCERDAGHSGSCEAHGGIEDTHNDDDGMRRWR